LSNHLLDFDTSLFHTSSRWLWRLFFSSPVRFSILSSAPRCKSGQSLLSGGLITPPNPKRHEDDQRSYEGGHDISQRDRHSVQPWGKPQHPKQQATNEGSEDPRADFGGGQGLYDPQVVISPARLPPRSPTIIQTMNYRSMASSQHQQVIRSRRIGSGCKRPSQSLGGTGALS